MAATSDQNEEVRRIVTGIFAHLVELLPLKVGYQEEDDFLQYLLDNKQIPRYQISIQLNVTLREYQKEGVSWLAFLRRYKLHGCLCDGKERVSL